MEESFFLDENRIKIFIGKGGEMKKKIEEALNLKLEVDSKSGEVIAYSEDSLNTFILSNIITAINYDMNPNNCLKLCEDNYVLDVIDVRNIVKKQDKESIKKSVGRIIGHNGVTRKLIEEITRCFVSIKDHYVCVIGPYENTILVEKAIEMLSNGLSHKGFYKYLERNRENMETGLL